MYQIAICDDDAAALSYLENALQELFDQHHIAVEIEPFVSGLLFLREYETHHHYDIIFLDIDMPEINGIEICRRIRTISPNSLCIFVSNKEELVFQTFEVQPFRFIRKSEFDTQKYPLFDSLLTELQRRRNRKIQFVEPRTKDIYSFEISQILYVEAQRKKVLIVTTSEAISIEMKFSDVEELLAQHRFLKPHRSFLVNCAFVSRIHKTELTLTNGQSIPISRNRIEELRREFIQFTSEELL